MSRIPEGQLRWVQSYEMTGEAPYHLSWNGSQMVCGEYVARVLDHETNIYEQVLTHEPPAPRCPHCLVGIRLQLGLAAEESR